MLTFQMSAHFAQTHPLGPDETAISTYMGAATLATFMTSIWVFLYGIGALFLKLSGLAERGLGVLRWSIDTTRRPFTAIAIIIIALATSVFLGGLLLQLLSR
jgi:hypothetical protein